MEDNTKKGLITQEDIMKMLDTCYGQCLNGIPKVSPNVIDMANEYLGKYSTKEKACKAMIKTQILKCTTSGFITGFGGFITLPVSIPANMASVIYVQMRMIACIAYMTGLDIHSDEAQTFIYACLAGVTVNEIVKKAGVKFGMKFAEGLIKRIPGKVLVKINQKVGFRFITKFGSKGLINLGKLVPGLGAVIGGSLDLVETKIIADRAYKWFFLNDFSSDDGNDGTDIIDVDFEEKSDTDDKSE